MALDGFQLEVVADSCAPSTLYAEFKDPKLPRQCETTLGNMRPCKDDDNDDYNHHHNHDQTSSN